MTLGLAVLGAIAFTGCMSEGANPGAADGEATGTVVVRAKTGNVSSLSKPGLGKTSVITLDSLIVTAISNASTPDTVKVLLAVGDSGLSSDVSDDQDVNIVLPLRALRTWYISAVTKDVNDSTIHSGADTVENLLAGTVRNADLTVDPLFSMYKASFTFPDSIYSPTGLFGQQVNISKIEIALDGDVVADEETAFEPDTSYELTYDYVTGEMDSVTLNVYGNLDGADAPWDEESLLYTNTVAIDELSTETTNNVSLTWEGPAGGVTDLTVEIGEVGTFEVEAGFPPNPLD